MSGAPEIAARLADVRQRIESAAARSGRTDSPRLIGASKAQPAERLRAAFAAGLERFGENRVQEALAKSAELPGAIEWHLFGPLQSNKARKAAGLFAVVHSLDRRKIALALDREAAAGGRRLDGFIEVNLGGETTKHGFHPEGLAEAVRPLADLSALRVAGLMAIPPFAQEAEASRPWFRRLRELRDELFGRAEWAGRPGWLSMGMSADFEIAVEEGATHVRVGTALFGPRP